MRLLMTTDTVGGVWSFTSDLTEQLLGRGHTVHLVSFGRAPSPDQWTWSQDQEEVYGDNFRYTPSDIPLEWMQNNDRAFQDGQAVLLEALETQPADLLLSNQFCFGRLGSPLPRIVVAHSDVLSWAKACRPSALEPSPWLNRYTSMVQAGLLDASVLITPTSWMGKALSDNFFLPRHYLVLPNGVSVEPPSDPPKARKLQAITAGRLWDKAKGLDTLLDLASPMPLSVAGDHTLHEAEPQPAWPEHLTQLGPLSRSDLHEHFRQSAIYLCTSRYEPFGLAPLEAALCGCAVVARDLPSLREVWEDNALYFSDGPTLTTALQALLNDPALLAEAQSRARRRAGQFTAERMATNYLHLFQNVLQQPQAVPHVA